MKSSDSSHKKWTTSLHLTMTWSVTNVFRFPLIIIYTSVHRSRRLSCTVFRCCQSIGIQGILKLCDFASPVCTDEILKHTLHLPKVSYSFTAILTSGFISVTHQSKCCIRLKQCVCLWRRIPPGSVFGKVFKWSFRASLLCVLSYGCYRLFRWTSHILLWGWNNDTSDCTPWGGFSHDTLDCLLHGEAFLNREMDVVCLFCSLGNADKQKWKWGKLLVQTFPSTLNVQATHSGYFPDTELPFFSFFTQRSCGGLPYLLPWTSLTT